MFESLLDRCLRQGLRSGALEVLYPSGRRGRYGDGQGPPVRVRIADAATLRAIALRPQLAVGEAYMDGRLILEAGDVYDLIELARSGSPSERLTPLARTAEILRGFAAAFVRVGPERARRNASHHYDLDEGVYRLFLDADMQYSCGYFETPDMSLEQAQLAKKRLIAAKLPIGPGARVLDIGSGWGGMAIYLALVCDAEVTGVTLSREQLRVATARVEALGLADRVRFELCDYRAVAGRYDAIVSVGMFEHVGLAHYRAFFDTLARRLDPAGVALLHAIGQPRRARTTQAFIAKHIFPDGFLPSLAQELAPIEPTGLKVRDVEVLALHYAETLREWRQRFLVRRAEAAARYDERFVRMWEFYLAGSESAFRAGLIQVYQVQLVHDPARIPPTRAYIAERASGLAEREAAIPLYAGLHAVARAPRRRAGDGGMRSA